MSRRTVAAAGAVGLVLAGFATLRYTGQPPFGSDNDEYLLVAQGMWSNVGLVAGVEGTKYPLGYPLVLAVLDAVALPVKASAVVLNHLLLLAAVALAARLARSHGGQAMIAAALFAGTGVAMWGATWSLMPDVALVAVVAATFVAFSSVTGPRDIATLALLVGLAAALKSVGLLLGGAATLGLLAVHPRMWRWAALPAAAALAVTALNAAVLSDRPEHTTGYAGTFRLVDPYDAAQGRESVSGVAARLVERADIVVSDAGDAVAGPHLDEGWARALAVALVALGVVGLGRAWPFGVAFVALYGGGLALWPYRSIRFGLLFLPLAALGAGVAAGALARSRWRLVGVPAVAALLMLHAAISAEHIADAADREEQQLAALHAATAEAERWAEQAIDPADPVASFEYRELALRVDRRFLPLGYTSDTAELWERSGGSGARWLMAIPSLYPRRAALLERLLADYASSFTPVYDNDLVKVWRVSASADPGPPPSP